MAAELKQLTRLRSTAKAQLTRLHNSLTQLSNPMSESAVSKLNERKLKLEEIYRNLLDIQNQIDDLQENVDSNDVREEFDVAYYACSDSISELLHQAKPTLSANTAPTAASVSPTYSSAPSIVPKVHIKPFDGNFAEWKNFHDTFVSIVHDNDALPVSQKFQLLKSYLTGNAAKVTHSLHSSPDSYYVAWELLQNRFNKPRQIVLSHLQALFELPNMETDSSLAIRALAESAEMHVGALKSLNQPTEWHEMLIYIITAKLDKNTRTLWMRSIDEGKWPTFQDLLGFLTKHSQDAEPVPLLIPENTKSTRHQGNPHKKYDKRTVNNPRAFISSSHSCPVCSQKHFIQQCTQFSQKSPNDRYQLVKRSKLCVNCLKPGHTVANCKASFCRECKGRHHTLLHFGQGKSQVESGSLANVDAHPPSPSVTLTGSLAPEILLSTARVKALDVYNNEHDCRLLIDSGSQVNFITEKLAKTLKLPQSRTKFQTVSGLAQSSCAINRAVKATFRDRENRFEWEAKLLVLPKITGMLPSREIDQQKIPIPSNITLADPDFGRPGEIDILLGEYFFYKLTSVGRIRLPNDTTVLQNTQLGWIISGNIGELSDHQATPICHVVNTHLEKLVNKFWEIEEGPIEKLFSETEVACEKHFSENVERNRTGRYIVRLPFNSNKSKLGDSYSVALKRFFTLERRFTSQPELGNQYSEFLDSYLSLGHMTDVTDTARPDEGFYLPHQAVIKEGSNTTKMRVVFDGSAKSSSGLTLNDALLVGPTIQDDLFALATRFRSHAFVLTADIEKMFRQIVVHPEDRKYQKILWRKSKSESVRTYELDTVTYGTASAPFLAVRCLQQLAEDEGHAYPLAARALKQDFYMDDLLTGASSLQEAQNLRDELCQLCEAAGFHLRQWASNEPSLLKSSPDNSDNKQLYLNASETKKTLGIAWNAVADTINYSISLSSCDKPITKRYMLSKISQLFDPLGLLGPVIIKAKILLQELWKHKLGWDEVVPPAIIKPWSEYVEDLPSLNRFAAPREIVIRSAQSIQLHGFCDASQVAYGACLYIRSSDADGHVITRLVCAKSRVAPLKSISLPRLELCAAALLVKLYNSTVKALQIEFERVKFWSDSTIALHWLNSAPHTLKTFVSNRVAKIQAHTSPSDWAHVPSAENPADHISRGQQASELISNHLWLEGPPWLREPESSWPKLHLKGIDIPEQRTVITLAARLVANPILTRFSTFKKLQRVVAYALRFKANALHHQKITGVLSPAELHLATERVIRLTQAETFSSELHTLRSGGHLEDNSKITCLTPFIDEQGILRVGGRLRHSNLEYAQKHPALLPRNHHVTRLIILDAHERHMHAGTQATLNAVRQAYWPINGRNSTRFIIRSCIRCFRAKPRNTQYTMGNLPRDRIVAGRPFQTVGVDYCGPFFIKEKRTRNTKRLKVYVAVFICFTTKAVHLELVSDLTTDAFMAALKRFCARRGVPRSIQSDNGTNFVGASNELAELKSLIQSEEHNSIVANKLAVRGIEWHFSPPRAPHFGGLWEAAVKSFKRHMIRTIGDALFTFEQLSTYVIEIEAILNSRPLTPLSSDPNDLQALTPAHFLIGESLASIPEPDLTGIPENRLSSWQHIQRVKAHFWTRWHKEYIHQLITRTKWSNKCADEFKIGALALIKDTNIPPMRWSLGRVSDIHPGQDGVIRVVTLRTSTGVLKRSTKGLCILPIVTEQGTS